MLRQVLEQKVTAAVQSLVAAGSLPAIEYPKVEITDTKSPEHGDFACNFALVASKTAQKNPREIGAMLATALSGDPDLAMVEVAGPGFVNLTVSPRLTARALGFVLSNPGDFYRTVLESPLRINVEFVSVNPNGPITVGSGRGAAYGSCLCNVLEAAGHKVHREYYINDGVNSEQMRLFAESVRALVEGRMVPENGYKGDYVHEVAESIKFKYLNSPQYDLSTLEALQQYAQIEMETKQAHDLGVFGVWFDTWFSEQSLHDSGKVAECVAQLVAKGVADESEERTKVVFGKGGEIKEVLQESQGGDDELPLPLREAEGLAASESGNPEFDPRKGAGGGGHHALNAPPPPNPPPPLPTASGQEEGGKTLWLRSTKFGDDMDRVLRRKDGRLTYIASDVAYHQDKFSRGSRPDAGGATERADKLITILGPDHHGYIGRLHAVVAASLMEDASQTPSLTLPQGGGNVRRQSVAEPDKSKQGEGGWSENDTKIWNDASEKQACQDALEEARKKLEVLIFQLVRFVKDGKPAPMRKRDGNIYALIDLINEIGGHVLPDAPKEEQQRVGRDVARFFYLMRSHDTTFDFDLDLAEKQSDENPVFYVQYAHARICGVIAKAKEAGIAPSPPTPSPQEGRGDSFDVLTHPKEKALIVKLQDLGHEVTKTAEDYSVNRLTTYAVELARTYHHFYDACRVIQPDQPELSRARLALCEATKASLQAACGLLGISAPEKM